MLNNIQLRGLWVLSLIVVVHGLLCVLLLSGAHGLSKPLHAVPREADCQEISADCQEVQFAAAASRLGEGAPGPGLVTPRAAPSTPTLINNFLQTTDNLFSAPISTQLVILLNPAKKPRAFKPRPGLVVL